MKVKEESEKIGLKLNIQKMKIMASGPITSWQIDGEKWQTLFWGSPKLLQMVSAAMKLKDACSLEEKLWQTANLKVKDITLLTKVQIVRAIVSPAVMYGCESWTIKKAECQRMMLLNCGIGENSWETLGQQGYQASQLLRKSILNIGRTDAEVEAPILQPSDAKSWLIWKDSDAGKDWGWEEKGTTEDEMVGWHHRLNGHEFE